MTQGSSILAYSDNAQPTPLEGIGCGGRFTAIISLPDLNVTGLRILLIIGAVQSLAALDSDVAVTWSKKMALERYEFYF